MKPTIEKFILLVISLVLLLYVLISLFDYPRVILFRLSEVVVFLAAFYFMVFKWVGDDKKTWNTKQRVPALVVLVFLSYFLMSITKIVMDLSGDQKPILVSYFFLPQVAGKFVGPLLSGLVTGIVYGSARYDIIHKSFNKFKKVVYGASVITLVFSSVLFWDLNYSGSDEILFLDRNQEISSIQELLSHPQLEGKKLYIDLWFSSCGPCISAFRSMDEGKKVLADKGYTTVYLGRETSHANSKQRWLNIIKKYNLEGHHVYMSKELENELHQHIREKVSGIFGYPHYLMVESDGTISNWDAVAINEPDQLRLNLKNTFSN